MSLNVGNKANGGDDAETDFSMGYSRRDLGTLKITTFNPLLLYSTRTVQ